MTEMSQWKKWLKCLSEKKQVTSSFTKYENSTKHHFNKIKELKICCRQNDRFTAICKEKNNDKFSNIFEFKIIPQNLKIATKI